MEKPKAEKPEQLLFSIADVCIETGFCYRTIHRKIQEGRIHSVRCGSAVRVPKAEVERILSKGF